METQMPEARLYRHGAGLFYDWKRAVTTFDNEYDDNKRWLIKEYWYAFVRRSKHFWEIGDLYYDGHTQKSITFLGIEIGYGYSYDSRPAEEWARLAEGSADH